MTEYFIRLISGLPAEMVTILLSMVPITESRAAVPLAISVMGLSVIKSIIYSVIGGIIAAVVIVNLLGPISGYMMAKSQTAEKFFYWLFSRTHHRLVGKYEKYGLLALMFFVAIPLPGTGVWTGALAAFVFGMPKKKSLVFIILGAIIASSILALATAGILTIF